MDNDISKYYTPAEQRIIAEEAQREKEFNQDVEDAISVMKYVFEELNSNCPPYVLARAFGLVLGCYDNDQLTETCMQVVRNTAATAKKIKDEENGKETE